MPTRNVLSFIECLRIALGPVREVTDRRTTSAIAALDRLNIELEQRVSERTEELASKTRALEAFTYTVVHDLKAPLRGIDGYSQLLLEDYLKTT